MKRLIFGAIVMVFLGASSSLVACGGGSCLDEYPCNVPADDGDGSYDGATHVTIDAAADASGDAIDDMSTIDDAQIDAEPDGSDASDD